MPSNLLVNSHKNISKWKGYSPTPLLKLNKLNKKLQLKNIFYKDESKRFHLKSFKALGGAYAVEKISKKTNIEIGKKVNVGAGTITCNYDGASKFKTVIKDKAFIGSNSSLVAPLIVGKNAYIGSGSTITKHVVENSLAVERSSQKMVKNWSNKKGKK